MSRRIFVFGSNLGGIHGAGAARHARLNCGARLGIGVGLTGDSYAIPTKNEDISRSLPLETIDLYVEQFVEFARARPDLEFDVTPIGCGLAGFKRSQIEPLFTRHELPPNIHFTSTWNDHHD